ncbi:hypothetical protein CI610_00343 [invertebrate metagenome]|uniref:Uncharacterized protein n=1 Tax=invertebrate metagenome TaxID=1711999 RepID=A0A2H9TBR0_9ZZZZ
MVQVFQLPHLIAGHPAILDSHLVVVRPVLLGATQQAVDVELHVILILTAEQLAVQLLLPAHDPRGHGVPQEADGQLADVIERGPLKVVDHVAGHVEDTGDLGYLKLSGLQKLAVLRRDADALELHALLQDRHAERIIRSAVEVFPLPAKPIHGSRVVRLVRLALHPPRMFQDTGQDAAVTEQPGAEGLRRLAQPDGFPVQGDGGLPGNAVESQCRDVQHLMGLRLHGHVANGGEITQAAVYDLRHSLVRPQRQQMPRLSPAVPHDVGISVSPAGTVGHLGVAPGEGSHPRVRLVMQHRPQGMPVSRLAAGLRPFPYHQGQLCQCLRQQPDAGIDGRDLHRIVVGHADAAAHGFQQVESGAGH